MTTNNTDIALPVSTKVHQGFLAVAKQTFPYFLGSLPGMVGKNQGTFTMTWESIANLATVTTPLGERTSDAYGQGRTGVDPVVTRVTATLAKYGNVIKHSEELDLGQINARSAQFIVRLGENAGSTLNELQRDILDGKTTDLFPGSGTSAATVDEALGASSVKVGVRNLGRASAKKFMAISDGSTNVGSLPIRDAFFGINHIDVSVDVRDMTGFVGVEQYASHAPTAPGEYGYVNGVRWIETETAPVAANTSTGNGTAQGFVSTGGTDGDVYTTFILGREAHGTISLDATYSSEVYMGEEDVNPVQIIRKSVGSSGIADPLDEVGSVGWKTWWAGQRLNEDWIYKIQTLASEPTV